MTTPFACYYSISITSILYSINVCILQALFFQYLHLHTTGPNPTFHTAHPEGCGYHCFLDYCPVSQRLLRGVHQRSTGCICVTYIHAVSVRFQRVALHSILSLSKDTFQLMLASDTFHPVPVEGYIPGQTCPISPFPLTFRYHIAKMLV